MERRGSLGGAIRLRSSARPGEHRENFTTLHCG